MEGAQLVPIGQSVHKFEHLGDGAHHSAAGDGELGVLTGQFLQVADLVFALLFEVVLVVGEFDLLLNELVLVGNVGVRGRDQQPD